MNTIKFYLIFFAVLYVVVFLVDYFLINKRKYNLLYGTKAKKGKKKNKNKTFGEIDYLTTKFKLDRNKIDYKSCILWISIINAFIISFVATLISAIPAHIIWQLLVGFVLLFALIYALYEIYGRILVKKGWTRDESQRNRS